MDSFPPKKGVLTVRLSSRQPDWLADLLQSCLVPLAHVVGQLLVVLQLGHGLS